MKRAERTIEWRREREKEREGERRKTKKMTVS